MRWFRAWVAAMRQFAVARGPRRTLERRCRYPSQRRPISMDHSRLSLPLGEAIFTQRSIRRFRPEPIPLEDIRLILETAVRAPNGGNQQIARFIVVNDRDTIRDFGALYREAWWAKRAKRYDEGFPQREDLPTRYHPAAGLADAMGDAPCIVLALALYDGPAN